MYKDYWEKKYQNLRSGNQGYLISDAAIASYREKCEVDFVKAIVSKKVSNGAMALDIGCGEGRIAFALANDFTKVVAVDLSRNVIDHNAKVYSAITNLSWVCNDIDGFYNSTDLKFDFIYIGGVLGYIENSELQFTVNNIKKLLSKNGVILLREMEYVNLQSSTDSDSSVVQRRKNLFYKSYGFKYLRKNIAYELAPCFYFFQKFNIPKNIARKLAFYLYPAFSYARRILKKTPYRICNYYIFQDFN